MLFCHFGRDVSKTLKTQLIQTKLMIVFPKTVPIILFPISVKSLTSHLLVQTKKLKLILFNYFFFNYFLSHIKSITKYCLLNLLST